MSDDRPAAWKILFRRALEIIDSVAASGTRYDDWSFGGGTVLMRRYHHRVSRDVDIFVPDPQYLGYVSPRLNDTAEALTSKYLETAIAVKLYFPEGEVDFIVSAPLTREPTAEEWVLSRKVQVDTTAEIMAKKVWHRGRDFTARDLFDFALVASRDPGAIDAIRPILRERRELILERIASGRPNLKTAFAALDVLDFRPSFENCVKVVADALEQA